MQLKVVVHKAQEGGYWAEVPTLPGCVTQGETLEELYANMREAIEGYLDIDAADVELADTDELVELAV